MKIDDGLPDFDGPSRPVARRSATRRRNQKVLLKYGGIAATVIALCVIAVVVISVNISVKKAEEARQEKAEAARIQRIMLPKECDGRQWIQATDEQKLLFVNANRQGHYDADIGVPSPEKLVRTIDFHYELAQTNPQLGDSLTDKVIAVIRQEDKGQTLREYKKEQKRTEEADKVQELKEKVKEILDK